jgi:serine/threonine protein kinase
LVKGPNIIEKTSQCEKICERDIAQILIQVVRGLEVIIIIIKININNLFNNFQKKRKKYIHNEGVVHGNLKPENCVYENEYDEPSDNETNEHLNDQTIKITDVALLKILDKDLMRFAAGSAIQYSAPEVFRNKITKSSDMWSFGCIAYLMLCGEEPFQAETIEEIYKRILKGNYNQTNLNYKNLSINGQDFLRKLLVVDPKNRLTASQALRNTWLTGEAASYGSPSSSLDTLRVLINKKKSQSLLQKQYMSPIDGKIPICQKYLPNDLLVWFYKTTSYGTPFIDCVKTAIDNEDTQIGLYAPDPDCYDRFPEIFWPVIAEYHRVDSSTVKSRHEFGNINNLVNLSTINEVYGDAIIASRCSISRSVANYPFGPLLTREMREKIKNTLNSSFKNLIDDLYGEYKDLSDMTDLQRDLLIKSHYLFDNGTNRVLKSAGGYKDW